MAAVMKKNLPDCTPDDFKAFVSGLNLPDFRAKQIFHWIFKSYKLDPETMNNLPPELRREIAGNFICRSSRITGSKLAGETEKLLITLADGEEIEMVIIPSGKRLTFCLSTQVGCPVGCRFCASGAAGLVRNLQSHEIIEQLYHGIDRRGRLPDNIVFMGIGEGLLNFDHLAAALQRITDSDYIGMSPRRITISTSGYVPGICRLTGLGKPFTLALSLHAVDDETRARIIPAKLRYPLAEILRACDDYQERIGRMVTFEYTLLAGINAHAAAAEKLAKLARKHHAKVNLIPYNETGGKFKRPAEIDILKFRDILKNAGASVTLRLERGAEANAACGQLRSKGLHRKNDD
ncbi:MAG: 23S rRNA (adenine(2503)-C(2))-methyltransferase RlmN [Victivallales bacterium]|nr:23S rRNA (adenine(2503)-C(2))-methyltransferase RlmN [Victivallales bacterium]